MQETNEAEPAKAGPPPIIGTCLATSTRKNRKIDTLNPNQDKELLHLLLW